MEGIILMTTFPNKPRDLKKFIMIILNKWLAKCINRINYVKSYYIREGKVQNNEEKILLIKTTLQNKTKLEEFIKKNHPYDTPEIIYLKPEEIEQKYLNRLIW